MQRGPGWHASTGLFHRCPTQAAPLHPLSLFLFPINYLLLMIPWANQMSQAKSWASSSIPPALSIPVYVQSAPFNSDLSLYLIEDPTNTLLLSPLLGLVQIHFSPWLSKTPPPFSWPPNPDFPPHPLPWYNSHSSFQVLFLTCISEQVISAATFLQCQDKSSKLLQSLASGFSLSQDCVPMCPQAIRWCTWSSCLITTLSGILFPLHRMPFPHLMYLANL